MSDRAERKRTSTEPLERLVGRADASPPPMRRPAAVSMGAVLVVLRVLGGAIWLLLLGTNWRTVIAEELDVTTVDADTLNASLAFIVVPGIVVLVVELVLAWLIFLGVNWARILVMIFATLSISGSFVTWWVGDQELHLDFTLVTLSLDILVMLALSSRAARAYARRPRLKRPPR
ncbi:hypothetical protein [Agromyces aureus]|uniref:Uncharacterized protein n=1 Tax=Agromyces aureus TaxID=453304 RepID=A0A191WBA9_9MICO|nr:hypothetical protein [Agromyces aureus]ANJ25527.1 hypothetical protein ATC03_00815 [Agromyces aureus]